MIDFLASKKKPEGEFLNALLAEYAIDGQSDICDRLISFGAKGDLSLIERSVLRFGMRECYIQAVTWLVRWGADPTPMIRIAEKMEADAKKIRSALII